MQCHNGHAKSAAWGFSCRFNLFPAMVMLLVLSFAGCNGRISEREGSDDSRDQDRESNQAQSHGAEVEQPAKQSDEDVGDTEHEPEAPDEQEFDAERQVALLVQQIDSVFKRYEMLSDLDSSRPELAEDIRNEVNELFDIVRPTQPMIPGTQARLRGEAIPDSLAERLRPGYLQIIESGLLDEERSKALTDDLNEATDAMPG